MFKTPICKTLVAALALSVLVAADVWAVQISLTNGDIVEGEIIEQNADRITVQTLTHRLTIPRSRIATISEGEPWNTTMGQAREALRRGQLDTAREFCDEAKALGAPDEVLNETLDEVRQQEVERELKRYEEAINTAEGDFKAGRQEVAIQALSAVVDSMPKDSPARPDMVSRLCEFHLEAARDFRDRVQHEKAMESLREVIRLDPTNAQAYIDLGDMYNMTTANRRQAIPLFRKALSMPGANLTDREKARLYWEMGEINRVDQNWREAAANYHRAHQSDPDVNARLQDRMLDAFVEFAEDIQSSEPEVALKVVEEGLKVRSSPHLMEMKGTLLNQLGRFKESDNVLAELAKLEPGRDNVNYLRALNHFEQGEILAGRQFLQKEVDINPRNYEALCLLGEYALQRDDFESATEFYGTARDLDSDNPKAMLGLGKTYRQESHQLEDEAEIQNKLEEAREAVEQVLARLPNDREANLEMGLIFRDDNKLDEAKEYFSDVLELIEEAPGSEQDELKELKADALIARGEISLLTAGPGTANIDFRAALEVLPEYPKAFYSIGQAYRRKYQGSKNVDDLKTAEENLLRAIELAPENAQFALELGIFYQQELAPVESEDEDKYLTEAVKYYQMYLDLGGANQSQVRQWINEIKGG